MNLRETAGLKDKDEQPSSLPFSHEIMLHIFSYLAIADLAAVALVNKEWKAVSEDESLWKFFITRHFDDCQVFNFNKSEFALLNKNSYMPFATKIAKALNDIPTSCTALLLPVNPYAFF